MWDKKPEETYDERKERIFRKVSLNNLDVSIDFTRVASDKQIGEGKPGEVKQSKQSVGTSGFSFKAVKAKHGESFTKSPTMMSFTQQDLRPQLSQAGKHKRL